MSNPTTPFSWQMPQNTDLVTDLPADFEVFGQAVATSMADLLGGTTGQVLSKTSNTDMDFTWVTSDDANAIQNTIVDAKGDLIGATAADTPARLAVGTNGQVLTADSTAATGLAWATSSSSNANYSLLNAGGTALTGATTITVSGISGIASIMILVRGASTGTANSLISIRLNGDTTAGNHESYGINNVAYSTYSSAVLTSYNSGTSATSFPLGRLTATITTGTLDAWAEIEGANSAGIKTFKGAGAGAVSGANASQEQNIIGGIYKGTSTISSISITSAGTFDAGTIFIYGSAV